MRSRKRIRMYLTSFCRCWMTDALRISQGRKVDFSNTVIIMTSNAGAKAIVEPKKLGFAAGDDDPAGDYRRMKQNVMDEVKTIFRPEFLNRIDETIVFHALDKSHMKKIVDNALPGPLQNGWQTRWISI